MWLLWCCGGSTVTLLREDEQRTFVVLLVAVVGVVFVLVVIVLVVPVVHRAEENLSRRKLLTQPRHGTRLKVRAVSSMRSCTRALRCATCVDPSSYPKTAPLNPGQKNKRKPLPPVRVVLGDQLNDLSEEDNMIHAKWVSGQLQQIEPHLVAHPLEGVTSLGLDVQSAARLQKHGDVGCRDHGSNRHDLESEGELEHHLISLEKAAIHVSVNLDVSNTGGGG